MNTLLHKRVPTFDGKRGRVESYSLPQTNLGVIVYCIRLNGGKLVWLNKSNFEKD